MPAQSPSISDPEEWENPPMPHDWLYDVYDNMPAFDPMVTPTEGMGKIPELFRTIPNTIRSNHPQVSFSANGKFAKKITENHELTPGFGMNSPLGRLYELNAKVLFLGVGYNSCTGFHLAEALNEKMPKKRMGTSMTENNTRVWKWFEDFNYDSDDFGVIGKEFEEKYDISTGMVGNAKCKLFDMKCGVDFAKDWLAENRFKNIKNRGVKMKSNVNFNKDLITTIDKVENERLSIEILQYDDLTGGNSASDSMMLYFMKKSNVKLRQVKMTMKNTAVRLEAGALYMLKGDIEMDNKMGGSNGPWKEISKKQCNRRNYI